MAVELFARGAYEPHTISIILSRLNRDGTYVDVGSNIGAIALPVATLRPGARVICVEADPDIAAILRRNVTENARANIEIVECLAGRESAESVKFYRAPVHKFGMGSIGSHFDGQIIELRQQALDDVFDDLNVMSINVLKIDVEGAELGTLRGLERHLKNKPRPTVVFEFADWAEAKIHQQSPGDAQAYLLSLGYRLFTLPPDGSRGVALNDPIRAGGAMILAVPGD